VVEDRVPPSPSRRDAAWFYGWCAFLWGLCCLMAYWTPIMLDDWYQVAYWQRHAFSFGAIWDYAHYNYFNYNPRLGENFLLVTNGPWLINVLLTPTIELLFTFVAFAMAFGRWPRPTARDARRLFLFVVVLWMVAPIPGILWFYRPFCCNYLYAFTFTLLLVVPYRLELGRDRLTYRSWWLAPLLGIWGWVAGMTNEHTGLTAALALGTLVYLLWRKHREIRAWMVTGLVGLLVGYPMLLFAPGQTKRYGGLANKAGPIRELLNRGVDGTYEVVMLFIWGAQMAIYLTVIAVLVSRRRRASEAAAPPPPTPDRTQTLTMLFLLAAAGCIVGTLFGSPVVGERLFFAPATLFAAAIVILLDVLIASRPTRRVVMAVCVVVFGYHVVRLFMIYPRAHRENAERIAQIEATPPGQIAHVTPYHHFGRSLWKLADDFGYASLREYVAHEVYGKGGIEFDRDVRAEPSPPYHMVFDYAFDPPLDAAEVERHVTMPLTYIPSYTDRDVQVIRRIVPQLRAIPGHRLISVTARIVGLDLPVLRGRPLLGVRWREDGTATGKFDMIDSRRLIDDDDLIYLRLWGTSLVPGLDEYYVRGCGKTVPIPPAPDPDGLRLTFDYLCRGLFVGLACTHDTCWLAGTTWR